ncbi:MAG: sugar phosphate isomerase/epimerase family protein, partial [Dehalococcoidia bacterium]
CVNHPESARYAVDFAITHGFNGIEFNAPALFLADLSPADREYLVAMANEHDLRYTHHFPPSALPGSHDAEQRVKDLVSLISEIKVAGELGVKVIVLHPGRLDVAGVEREDVSEVDRALAMSYYIDFVKSAAPVAESSGVVIGLENMHYNPGWVVRSHQELAESVDIVDSPAVKITFDTGHAWGSGGVEAGIELLGDRIAHVQVHDARGPEGAGNVRDQHKELGTGLIDWAADSPVAKFVAKNGFVATIETSGFVDDREQICVRSLDLLRDLWG